MTSFAGICFGLSAIGELGGLWLLIRQARAAGRQLEGWEAANPERNELGSYDQLMLLNPVVTRILGEQSKPRLAVSLLGGGIVAGLVGNFASLG